MSCTIQFLWPLLSSSMDQKPRDSATGKERYQLDISGSNVHPNSVKLKSATFFKALLLYGYEKLGWGERGDEGSNH